MSMTLAETARQVLHKNNYQLRLGWNAAEISDLALKIALTLKDNDLEGLASAIVKSVHARMNEQRASLPEESAKWWGKLS